MANILEFEVNEAYENRVKGIAVLKRHNTLKMLKQFVTIIGLAVAVIPVMIYAIIYSLNK